MPRKTVIIGGGAAGLGAATGVKTADPSAEVVVYTREAESVYGSAGIPADEAEVEDFEKLLVADTQTYLDAGVAVHFGADVTAIDTAGRTITVGGAPVSYDNLVIAAGTGLAGMMRAVERRGAGEAGVGPSGGTVASIPRSVRVSAPTQPPLSSPTASAGRS